MSISENKSALDRARKVVPFLHEIPDDVYFSLDHREWLIPEGAVDQARQQLETMLGQYVMTYNRDIFLTDIPLHHHLCAHLGGADLSADQREMLNKLESVFRDQGISFVVYKKPFMMTPVRDSYIYRFSRKHARNQ